MLPVIAVTLGLVTFGFVPMDASAGDEECIGDPATLACYGSNMYCDDGCWECYYVVVFRNHIDLGPWPGLCPIG